MEKEITQGELKEVLHYDADSGSFTWLKAINNRIKVGGIAGCLDRYGYMRIQVLGKVYQAHRLAFLYQEGKFPLEEVDHINHKKDDNRWSNIRHATRVENSKNRGLQLNNKSGFNGVSWEKARNKWKVKIKINGKSKHLGRFTDIKEAIACRKMANIDFGYHPNHGAV
jgi:hypothetical protein